MGNKSGYFSLVILLASVASAQDRTFLFTVTPQITEARNILVHYDAGRDFKKWKMHGNLILEKPLSSLRDNIDVITTIGFSRSVSKSLRLGFEAIGEDLEGFWEKEEAEGGAKLLIGPSLHVASGKSRWQFTIGGGPIFYATKSNRDSGAPRALPNVPGETGYSVRTSLSYGL